MASQGAIWGPPALRILRVALIKSSKAVRNKLVDAAKPFQGLVQPGSLRSAHSGRQPIHPAALLKQQKRRTRWFSHATAQNINRIVRRYLTTEQTSGARLGRAKLPISNTSTKVAQSSGRAPFATTLRPNLTGGALPRTAGGYSLGGGGGARYFSHTPAAPAQVVQNVSQAMRAFLFSGQRIRYDGVGPRGEHQYRAVSQLENLAMNKLSDTTRLASGSFIDFRISPTLTALNPLAAALADDSQLSGFGARAATVATCLNTDGFLDVLSTDFGRALKDLAMVISDLRRLSALGAVPITEVKSGTLRVRFPGVDALTLERLCDEIGIQRGLVGQDADFDVSVGASIALKFPFAPESGQTASSPGGSVRSLEGHELDESESSLRDDDFMREAFALDESPWLSEMEGCESPSLHGRHDEDSVEDFEGLEGIWRFLAETQKAPGRLGS